MAAASSENTTSRSRIEQLAGRLSALHVEAEKEGADRRSAIESRLKTLDERLTRSQLAEDTKQRQLQDQLAHVQEQLASERASRELLDERKSKELQLAESNAALELAEERQARAELEERLGREVDERFLQAAPQDRHNSPSKTRAADRHENRVG